MKESGQSFELKEVQDKDLAHEDALSLVSEFVKDIKKKFTDKKDRLEILADAGKVLQFYIDEIENSKSDFDIMSVSSAPSPISFDDDSEDDSLEGSLEFARFGNNSEED
jgi:hypothetical protein